jgi:hypothetical protein
MARCRVDATTRLRPWNGRGSASLDSIETGANLGRPHSFGVGVDVRVETLNQFSCEGRSLFIRESKRLG